jgi:ligand-binding sensor domain-containing protein/signal transduction histidine kinase
MKINHAVDMQSLALSCFSRQTHSMPNFARRTSFQALRDWDLLLLLSGSIAATAATPPHYSLRTWQTEDGLPQNSVTALVQTRDGYIWLGTYGGLVRFDGARFVVFDSDNTTALKDNRITSLFEDHNRILWIGHETGNLTRLQSGVFAAVEVPGGWSGGKILRIGADENNDIWLMNKEGLLARLTDGSFVSPEEGAGPAGLVSFAKDNRGKLWILRAGKLSIMEKGRLALVYPVEGDRGTLDAICAARDGGVWGLGGGRVRKWKDAGNEEAGQAWSLGAITVLQEIQQGELVIGTPASGFYLLSPDGSIQNFSRTNGLGQNWVACFCIDREDNLWVGSGNGGLSLLRPVNFEPVNPPDKWNGMAVLSVSVGSGGLWIGTEGAGLYHLQNGNWTQFGGEDGLVNRYVWSVLEDGQSRLWAGTWGGGLFLRHGDKFQVAPGLEGNRTPMTALLHGRDGELWVGTGSGLLRYEDGRTVWYGRKQGLKVPDVRAVHEDAERTVWFGMSGGGLGCLKNGLLKQYRKEDGLASDFVLCLHEDAGGALWIGTANGLSRLKNEQFSNIGAREGLQRKTISHIEDDGLGSFWLSTEGGILRAEKTELQQCADGKIKKIRCSTYGRGDGLETIDCLSGFQPAGCKTFDGRLWFPTRKGLVVVDPANLRSNPLPPPVYIEDVRLDGAAQNPNAKLQTHDGVLKIPPGRHRFDFEYTALSFAAPEKVEFKYRLEGAEPDWIEAGAKRNVTYNFLPPGDYQFHVIACNNDGVWNQDGATLAMTVLPFFWQTWWFKISAYLAGAAVAGGLVWFEARRRHRRKLEMFERQRALERERARIAKDIHDDLGASLTRITMLTQSAHKELESPQAAAGHLRTIYSTARELTRAMDEIVWAVNPKHDTLDSVATYLVRFAQDFLNPAGIRCRLEMPVRLPSCTLNAEVRHNLFLSFKEALNNIAKHADASEVRISLDPTPTSFALSVEDNGKGFIESEVAANAASNGDRLSSGNGLGNMRRRMEEVGGSCLIDTAPGKGTRVKFLVQTKEPYRQN